MSNYQSLPVALGNQGVNRFSSPSRRFATCVLCLATCFLATNEVPLMAQDELPTGEELMDEVLEATGGRAAYDKITNRVSKGTLAVPSQGIELTITIYAAKPNRMYSFIDSEVTGKIESGTDGTVVWENSLLAGPQLKTGRAAAQAIRDATFDRLAYWREHFDRVECTGKEAFDGKDCFRVVLHPKPIEVDGDQETTSEPLTLFVDAETKLVAKFETKAETEGGAIPLAVVPGDYRELDGVLLPHKMVSRVLGQERVITMTEIKQNVDLPDDRFALPKEIQELVDKDE